MKKIIYISILLIGFFGTNAQSPDFTEVTSNLIYTNPAFAGTKVCPRLILSYRNKFVSLGSTYQTYMGTFDRYVDEVKGDIGILVTNDLQSKGVITNTSLGAIYGKDINITKNMVLKLALQAEYLRHAINTGYLSYSDMIDPIYGFIYKSQEPLIEDQFHKANISAGLLAYSEKQYIGISLFNINQPTSSLANKNYILHRKISVHYAYNIVLRPEQKTIKSAYFLLPNIMIVNQGSSNQLCLGMNVTKNFLMGGFMIKNNLSSNFDSFSLIIGFIQKKFKFAYNCDMSMAQVTGKFLDTHEATLTYYFNCVEKKKKNKAINCPGI